MKRWMALMLGLVVLLAAFPALAQEKAKAPAAPAAAPAAEEKKEEEEPPDPDEVFGEYFGRATHKFMRGTVNTFFGWVSIPIQTWREGSFGGFLGGTKDFAVRTGTGLVEIVTFPVPWPEKNYGPIVTPEFPTDRPEEEEEPLKEVLEKEKEAAEKKPDAVIKEPAPKAKEPAKAPAKPK